MSKIEWTDETWNPTTGCNKVSRGCKNCYAETMHKRLGAMGIEKYQHEFLGDVRTHLSELRKPISWKKPRMIFVNSMSDLFHEDVPFDFIDKVFQTMALTPQHTYQILTKRPERMAEYLNSDRYNHTYIGFAANTPKPVAINWPLKNVWLGTSVENQEQANKRIPFLLQCPATVRFLSCEPLLGAVNFRWMHVPKNWRTEDGGRGELNEYEVLRDIHWVIAGGESGPKAQPMHPDWARTLRDQCVEAGVPFFFKQWGQWMPTTLAAANHRNEIVLVSSGETKVMTTDPTAVVMRKVGKHHAGNLLDGRTWAQFPGMLPSMRHQQKAHIGICANASCQQCSDGTLATAE